MINSYFIAITAFSFGMLFGSFAGVIAAERDVYIDLTENNTTANTVWVTPRVECTEVKKSNTLKKK